MMKRILSILLAAVVALSAMLSFASVPAFAHDDPDDDDDDEALRLNLLFAFFVLGGEIEFPEDEDFFVSHGWGFDPWSTEDQVAALSDATRFDLLVDGELQESDETLSIDLVADTAAKLFRTDFDDDDAEDTHVFTAIFLLDAQFFGGTLGDEVVFFTFDVTVHFVEFEDDDDD